MLSRFFLLRDRAQHIAGPGDVGQIDLGLEFVFGVRGARSLPPRGTALRVSSQVLAHQLRLMLFQ
jgi:hypothetical protein